MSPNRRTPLLVAAALVACQLGVTAAAGAEPVSPLYRLVDTAAQRLATADPVAAAKWINGGSITDTARVQQVLDGVTVDANGRGVDAQYVRTVFTDQIGATEGVEYTRFGEWKFDPSTAPTVAPDLSESRSAIDGFTAMMVEEIALQWNSLHSSSCPGDLQAAEDAVAADRGLDPLYVRALSSAARSYCQLI